MKNKTLEESRGQRLREAPFCVGLEGCSRIGVQRDGVKGC